MSLWYANSTSKVMPVGEGNTLLVLDTNNEIFLLNPFALYYAPVLDGKTDYAYSEEPSYSFIPEVGNHDIYPKSIVASNVNFAEGDTFGVYNRSDMSDISDNKGWSSELFWVYLVGNKYHTDGEEIIKAWGPFNIQEVTTYYNAVPGSTLPIAKSVDMSGLSIRDLQNSTWDWTSYYYGFTYPYLNFKDLVTETYVPPQEHSSKVTVSTLSHYHSKLDNDIFTPLDEIISNTAVNADINELF